MLYKRNLIKLIINDLMEKMVFVGGPRQVGKTTLAVDLIAEKNKFQYLNWDYRADRNKILKAEWPADKSLLIFDEIHKYAKWKNLIKGLYDKYKNKYRIMVTGSARLNVFRKGGDSLQGRYHYYRLHPFSLAELINKKPITYTIFSELQITQTGFFKELQVLDKFGGFPEPLFKQSERALRRWHTEKLERIFRDDIQNLELIRDLGSMQLLGDMLPEKTGSQLSINSIREDLEVSHKAVTKWLGILENLYYCFRIYPYINNSIRSLKKEAKLYLWDWSEVENEASRFENLIACHLLKFCHFLYDSEGYQTNLYYLRDVDKRELDFLITVKNKPWFAIEVKMQDSNINRNTYYFKKRINIPFVYQVIKKTGIDFLKNNIRVISADKFLYSLV